MCVCVCVCVLGGGQVGSGCWDIRLERYAGRGPQWPGNSSAAVHDTDATEELQERQ